MPRLLVRQTGGRAFLYDAARHATLAVPKPPLRCTCAVWDACNAEVFLLAGSDGLHVYRYETQSTRGPRVVRLSVQAPSHLDNGPAEPIRNSEDVSFPGLTCRRPSAETEPVGHRWSAGRPLLCRNGVLTWCGDDGLPRHGVLATHTALQVLTHHCCV